MGIQISRHNSQSITTTSDISFLPLICVDISQSASNINKWCNIIAELTKQFSLDSECYPSYRIGCNDEELSPLTSKEYLRGFTEIQQAIEEACLLPTSNQKSFGDIIEKAMEISKQYIKVGSYEHIVVFIMSDAVSCNPQNDLWQVGAAEKYPITIILLTEDRKSGKAKQLKHRDNFYQVESSQSSTKALTDIIVKRHNSLNVPELEL
ncbi:Hypothetical_protein [Hexamita inflata]|uniref:Hypothetical_protein n=1 Tax=Hexamita inflata TaxID=28002 RepID=A0AA86URP8_9EUKA|nr:Hypothetical protein HINF_LOCUS56685 [Hexamita inflata]